MLSLIFTKVSLEAGLLPRRLLPVRLLQTRGRSSSLFLCRLGHNCFSDFHPLAQAKPHFLEPHWGQFFQCSCTNTAPIEPSPARGFSEITSCHLYGRCILPEIKVINWTCPCDSRVCPLTLWTIAVSSLMRRTL